MLNSNLGKPELKKDENNTSFSVGDTVEEKLASSTLRPVVSQDRYKGEEKTIIDNRKYEH